MITHIDTRWQMLALVMVLGVLLYVLGPALTPFLVAAIFAYLFNPLASRLERLAIRTRQTLAWQAVGEHRSPRQSWRQCQKARCRRSVRRRVLNRWSRPRQGS